MILVWEKFPHGLVLNDSPGSQQPTALLRATNAKLDASGTLILRGGRQVLEGPFPDRVRSLFAILVDGVPRRYAVSAQALYRDGTDILDGLPASKPDMWFVAFGPVAEST